MRVVFFAAILLLGGSAAAADVVDVPLPGDSSRFDYASFDAVRHRLFIAHLGASEVLVFDTEARAVVGRIAQLSDVHGVLAIPELHRVYASATGTNEVVAIDADTLNVVARAPTGRYPDGMAFAPPLHKLYVSDETGATETVIDTDTNRRIATIELGGEAGNTQYDPTDGRIYVNVQTRAELVAIDPTSDRIVARIALPGARGNHGLLIDAAHRRAFVACEGNDRLLVLDLAAGKVRATFDVGHAPDVLAQDEKLGRVFVASESGVVSVFDAAAAAVSKRSDERVGSNAHVVAIDTARHLAYFPLKDAGHGPVLRIVSIEP